MKQRWTMTLVGVAVMAGGLVGLPALADAQYPHRGGPAHPGPGPRWGHGAPRHNPSHHVAPYPGHSFGHNIPPRRPGPVWRHPDPVWRGGGVTVWGPHARIYDSHWRTYRYRGYWGPRHVWVADPYWSQSDWANIAIAAGLFGAIGALNNDPTLFFIGSAGALYAVDQYEADRYADNRDRRLRAMYFSRPYFIRDGYRFDRITEIHDGRRFYRFVRR